jgi:hypothetical protein
MIRNISTFIYRVWHHGKYTIIFKLVTNHRTNGIMQHIVVSSGQWR